MGIKIDSLPIAYRSYASQIGDRNETLTHSELETLYTLLRENKINTTELDTYLRNNNLDVTTTQNVMNPETWAINKLCGKRKIDTCLNPLNPNLSVTNDKVSKADIWIDPANATLKANGIKTNLNPVQVVFGKDNGDSNFSKCERIADPLVTTLLDNTKLSKDDANKAMWIINPIGKLLTCWT